MTRFLSTVKTDIIVQFRTKLYAIGIVVGVLVAVILSQLALPEHLPLAVPALLVLVVGGSTLLYVGGMIIFERDDGTLQALITSPLRTSEYIWSKVLSLSLLAAVESIVMVGGAMLIMLISREIAAPHVLPLLFGVLSMGIIYTLIGVILIVRYDKITDFLFPMAAVAVLLQLPFFYFFGLVEHPLLLVVPTSAPAMLMRGAYYSLEHWEWLYGIGYTLLWIAILAIWSFQSFDKHVVMRMN